MIWRNLFFRSYLFLLFCSFVRLFIIVWQSTCSMVDKFSKIGQLVVCPYNIFFFNDSKPNRLRYMASKKRLAEKPFFSFDSKIDVLCPKLYAFTKFPFHMRFSCMEKITTTIALEVLLIYRTSNEHVEKLFKKSRTNERSVPALDEWLLNGSQRVNKKQITELLWWRNGFRCNQPNELMMEQGL